MSKGGSQTQTTTVDPRTQAYVNQLRQTAQGAGAQYAPYQQAGNLGLSALTGNAGAQQQFLNPYFSQMNPFFAQQRAGAVEGANQQATLAGAFGGDRSQIGAATAGNLVDQNQAFAQYQAFQDAMQRAGYAANLGFGAIGAPTGLMAEAIGPYGQTQATKTKSDLFSQLLAIATIASKFVGGNNNPNAPQSPGFPTPASRGPDTPGWGPGG